MDKLFNKIIPENFPNLEKEKNTQVEEASRTPNHQDQKGNTPRNNVINTLNIQNKKRILKTSKREKTNHIYRQPIRIRADFST
jgi:uncharacterized sporulation protein YeaH/YhbH (DUF444 family)